MSLRSGKQYQPASQQQDERVEKQQEPNQSADAHSESVYSRSSKRSSQASSAIRARAKAEATRAQLAYAEKETSIIQQKADLGKEKLMSNKDNKTRDLKIICTPFRPERQSFYPLRELSYEPQGMRDITKYLIWLEMLSVGLLRFDDRPENHWSWKASFQSATKDLNISAREELDSTPQQLST